MSEPPPIIEARAPTEDEVRLAKLFDDLETKQLEFLDEGAKRIAELCTAVLTLLFAITAFGDKFPPAYMKGNSLTTSFAILTLVLFLVALLASLTAALPREYKRYRHNLTEMRSVLDDIVSHKLLWVRIAGVSFLLGMAGLASFMVIVLLSA